MLERLDLEGALRDARAERDALARHKRAESAAGKITLARLDARSALIDALLETDTRPSWCILTTLPVLPPAMRGLADAAIVEARYRALLRENEALFREPEFCREPSQRYLDALDSLFEVLAAPA